MLHDYDFLTSALDGRASLFALQAGLSKSVGAKREKREN